MGPRSFKFRALALLALACFGTLLLLRFSSFSNQFLGEPGLLHGRQVLVMYIFSATDAAFLDNLRFFLTEAVQDDRRCEYLFVLQVDDASNAQNSDLPRGLPELPPHAKYIVHHNECYDWGTFGWVMNSGIVNLKQYRYFMFINSSVRGPFMPAYVRGKMHWTEPFLSRIKGDVKLVGPTISCEGSPHKGDVTANWRRNPHVQSYALATDRIGLQVLRDDGRVFECHSNRWDAIYYSELGSSAAILRTGYNIDSFMIRYQGVDWRIETNWQCNQQRSPVGESFYDGITLDPMEVMFVKYKSYISESASIKATKYGMWMHPEMHGVTDLQQLITANEYVSDTIRFKVPKVLEQQARGSQCFDFKYYLDQNEDLRKAYTGFTDMTPVWKHFVEQGQFESRHFRFTCPFNYSHVFAA